MLEHINPHPVNDWYPLLDLTVTYALMRAFQLLTATPAKFLIASLFFKIQGQN